MAFTLPGLLLHLATMTARNCQCLNLKGGGRSSCECGGDLDRPDHERCLLAGGDRGQAATMAAAYSRSTVRTVQGQNGRREEEAHGARRPWQQPPPSSQLSRRAPRHHPSGTQAPGRSVPVTAIANPFRAVGDVKWLQSRGGETVRQSLGFAPGGAFCRWEGRAAVQPLPAEGPGGHAGLGVPDRQEWRRVSAPGRKVGQLWRGRAEQMVFWRTGDAARAQALINDLWRTLAGTTPPSPRRHRRKPRRGTVRTPSPHPRPSHAAPRCTGDPRRAPRSGAPRACSWAPRPAQSRPR